MENIDSRIPSFGFCYCLLQRVDGSLADFCNKIGHKRTHALQQRTSLFNHFLGAAEQREWESDARAIAFAMPLLQKADRVTVLTVIGGTEVSGPSAEQLVRNLRRNWIGAELKKAELDGRSNGETILATAQSLGCDLLIKGAYTQSRLRQMIFGGATQHVLENAMIPVLLAN